MKFATLGTLFLLSLPALLPAQPQDTVHFQWPNQPFNSSHFINGTFCEYRNTLSANHFHSGVDIGEPDGNPIYSSLNGIVHSLSSQDGANNFVRVRSLVGGQWKHISYVHINPALGLLSGDNVVAGVTVLGTIISGQGHVHLTERELVVDETGPRANGIEINAVRSGGGLYPFEDTYPPVIDQSQILFRQTTTNSFLPSNSLFGNVEFIVKVSEHNGTSPSQVNNGTYLLGYRILTDSLTVVYEPPDGGIRFRFDRKPFDAVVDNVFFPAYSNTGAHYYRLTSGLGATDIYTTRNADLGSVDLSAYPEGNYVLQIFTEDTRANTSAVNFPIFITDDDLLPPGHPTLSPATVDSAGTLTVSWIANSEPDVAGYRLHYFDGTNWITAASESTLTSGTTSVSFPAPPSFLDPADSLNKFALALTAVDTAMNESARSDIYATAYPWFTNAPGPSVDFRLLRPILVVDGFDRFGGTGSWQSPTHNFVKLLVDALPPLASVSTCSNEAVISGSVNLSSYHLVFWLLGDESTADNTLTSVEQAKLKAFLEGGGNLFISGSEIGWDLGRTHGNSEPGDTVFYHEYLKAKFVYDGNAATTAAQGISGTIFDSLTVTIGQTYPEDYPDDIDPMNGASPALIYNTKRLDGSRQLAGISYAGIFGTGTAPGRLVYISFPFETIGSATYRNALIQRVVTFFGIPTGIRRLDAPLPATFNLSQNYPNPFNPSTRLTFSVPFRGPVSLRIFDMLGREVARVFEGEREAGTYVVDWDAALFPSGTYFAVADFGQSRQTKKLMLLR